jgi:NAD(P)-dependent dehydrogenase (short-subunit alcohol dehydrogenase family)
MRLKDKVCIITGASSGMGLEAAKLFAREGAKVVRTDIKEGPDVPGSTFVKADVSREADCKALIDAAVKSFGGLDVLHNNAGIFPTDDH